MTKKAFTLVELIVVITILAVLGTVAFVSFQDYVGNSRDSKRTTDIKNIEKALELSKLQTGVYPNPGTSTNITYSGATAWKQGEFNNEVVRVVRNFKEAPKDPLVDTFYGYSVTKNRGEYQLGGVLEDIDYGTSANGKLAGAYVKGNYNGKTVKVSTGSTTYVLAAPSILTSDLNETDLLNIINAQKLVYKNHKNLPASYTGTTYDVNGGFEFIPKSGTIVAYEGDLATVDSTTLVDNLQKIYTGTVVSEEPDIEVIFSEDKDLTTDVILNKKPGTTASSSSSSSSSGGGVDMTVKEGIYSAAANNDLHVSLDVAPITPDSHINFYEQSEDIIISNGGFSCQIAAVVGQLPTTTATVTVFVNSKNYTMPVTIESNGNCSYNIPISGVELVNDSDRVIEVHIVATADDGRMGESHSTEAYFVKTSSRTSLRINAITGDDILSVSEAAGNVLISGRASFDAYVGNNISMVINGNTYTTTLSGTKTFSVSVLGSDLQNDSSFTVNLNGFDQYGNPLSATKDKSFTVQ